MNKILKLLLSIFLLIIINSCSKDDSSNIEELYHQNPDVAENVILISSGNSQIVSSESDLSNGVYNIEFSGSIPRVETNDIIIGEEDDGFIRKVTSSTVNGNAVSIKTTQANMEDVFKNATIEFTTDISESSKTSNSKSSSNRQYQGLTINYLASGVTLRGDGLEYDFSDTVLYQEGPLTFKITNGTATFNPNFSFKSEYSFFSLEYLDFKADNANLAIDCDLLLNANASVNLPTFSKKLADFDKYLKFLVGGLPVVVKVNTKLVAKLNAGIDASFDLTTGFTNNYTVTTGVKYENDNWTGVFDYNSSLTPKPINMQGEVNIAQNLTITPKVSVMFYGVIGPYCEPAMTEDFAFNIASPSLDWDSNLKVGLDVKTGVKWDIFSVVKGNYIFPNANFEETIWRAPESLVMVSGNNQKGGIGQQLPEPLKVKVTDNLNNPVSNVPVYFMITSGDGSVDNESIMTDSDGFVEVLWTLGGGIGEQSVEANIKNASGENIAQVNFASISEGFNLGGDWHMKEFVNFNETPGSGFEFFWEAKYTLDVNGYSSERLELFQSDSSGEWFVKSADTYLTFDAVNSTLHYGLGERIVFTVNSIHDTVFFGEDVLYPNKYKYELYRQ